MSEDKAITTGAPVATNDKQAAELGQQYRVWCLIRNEWHGGAGNVPTTYSEAQRYSSQVHKTEVRPYPTPTPRPTPGGEFTTRGSTVYRDDTSYAVCVNPRAATSIARRLNAADAMEKALKDIDNLPFHATHAEVIAIVMRYKAALRGGA